MAQSQVPARAAQGGAVPSYPQRYGPPIDALPTTQLKIPPRPRPGAPLRWFRTVRGRVALTYSAVLLVLLVTIGVVVNVAMSSALYAEERNRLSNQARASVALLQPTFNSEVAGSGAACANALSYQQAFDQSIGTIVVQQPLLRRTYLLDAQGVVLAGAVKSPQDGPVVPGDTAPYYHAGEAARLKLAETLSRSARQATGTYETTAYDAVDANGQRMAIILIADTYRTASNCVPHRPTTGQIEFVASYDAVQATLDRLHLILLLVIAGLLVLGVAVGAPLVARALRPLTRMTATAARIAQGDLSQRVRLCLAATHWAV